LKRIAYDKLIAFDLLEDTLKMDLTFNREIIPAIKIRVSLSDKTEMTERAAKTLSSLGETV
jgi:hypothetical protein